MERKKETAISFKEHRRNILRLMTAEEKLHVASKLYYSALTLKEARLRRIHSDWDIKKTQQKAREWMLYARS